MHVLHIVNNARRGGAGFVILPIIEELSKRGVSFTVAYMIGPEHLIEEYHRLGAKTLHLGKNPFKIIRTLIELILRKQNPVSIIHTHLVQASLVGRVVGRLMGIPVMTTRHYRERSKPLHPLYILEDITSRYSQRVIAISNAVREHLIDSRFSSIHRCRTIYSPIDLKLFEGYESYDLRPKVKIVFNGRFIKLKGIEYLLQAFEEVADELEGSSLVLMGRYERGNPILDLVNKHPQKDRIAIKGFVEREEIIKELNEARLYVQPSLSEGLGLAALEAMGMGCPCILSDAGGLLELAEDGQNAITVPARDVGALSKAMLSLWQDTDLSKRLGKNAKRFVENKFNARESANLYFAQYKTLEERDYR